MERYQVFNWGFHPNPKYNMKIVIVDTWIKPAPYASCKGSGNKLPKKVILGTRGLYEACGNCNGSGWVSSPPIPPV